MLVPARVLPRRDEDRSEAFQERVADPQLKEESGKDLERVDSIGGVGREAVLDPESVVDVHQVGQHVDEDRLGWILLTGTEGPR